MMLKRIGKTGEDSFAGLCLFLFFNFSWKQVPFLLGRE